MCGPLLVGLPAMLMLNTASQGMKRDVVEKETKDVLEDLHY